MFFDQLEEDLKPKKKIRFWHNGKLIFKEEHDQLPKEEVLAYLNSNAGFTKRQQAKLLKLEAKDVKNDPV
jgi:hypothetical protein